jgi:hypothetical protein
MPIAVQHQPQAATLAGGGLFAGTADYRRWLAQFMSQQNQFAAEQALRQRQQDIGLLGMYADWLAQQQALQQRQQENQRALWQRQQENQQALQQRQQENQQAWQQRQQENQQARQFEAERIKFQRAADQQDFINRAALQDYLITKRDDLQEARDYRLFQNKLDIEDLHQQNILDRQLALQQAQNRQREAHEWISRFNNPFEEHRRILDSQLKSGMSFTADEQKRLNDVQNSIRKLQDYYAENGEQSLSVVMPEFQRLYRQMMSITPNRPPPTPLHESLNRTGKATVYFDDGTVGHFVQEPGSGRLRQVENKDDDLGIKQRESDAKIISMFVQNHLKDVSKWNEAVSKQVEDRVAEESMQSVYEIGPDGQPVFLSPGVPKMVLRQVQVAPARRAQIRAEVEQSMPRPEMPDRNAILEMIHGPPQPPPPQPQQAEPPLPQQPQPQQAEPPPQDVQEIQQLLQGIANPVSRAALLDAYMKADAPERKQEVKNEIMLVANPLMNTESGLKTYRSLRNAEIVQNLLQIEQQFGSNRGTWPADVVRLAAQLAAEAKRIQSMK